MFYPPMTGYLVVAAVCVFLIIYQRTGAIRRNSALGIRTRHTLKSDAAWDAGQRAGTPFLCAIAAIGICHAVALLVVELADATTLGHILSVLGWILIVVTAVLAARAANSAARSAGS